MCTITGAILMPKMVMAVITEIVIIGAITPGMGIALTEQSIARVGSAVSSFPPDVEPTTCVTEVSPFGFAVRNTRGAWAGKSMGEQPAWVDSATRAIAPPICEHSELDRSPG